MTIEAPVLDSKLWHITQCPLFSALSEKEREAVRSASEMIELPKNQVVPAPPPDEPSLYVVKRGHVQLTYTDIEGEEAVVMLLAPGDVFGSLVSDESAYGEHCRTVTEACLCRVGRERFDGLVRRFPDLATRLTKLSFLRIQRLQVRLAQMMMLPAEARLARALLDLDDQVGRDAGTTGRKLTLPLTHANLAKLIGTSREMVTHLVGRFRKAGLIRTEKGWIYLLDPAGLRAMAQLPQAA